MPADDGPPTLPLPVLLGLSPLFAQVSGEGRDVLARFFHRVSLQEGEVLLRQGEPAELLYLIASGAVEVLAEEGDRPLRLARLGPGEILGEVALNHTTTRNASVVVVEAGAAWAVPVAAFRGLALAGDPVATAVLAGLGRILCQRLRAVDQKIAALSEVAPLPPGQLPELAPPPGRPTTPDPSQLPLMRTLPVFALLEERLPGALDRLRGYLLQWELPEGAELFQEGMPGESAFVVLRGAIEVAVARGIMQQRLALLGPGRLFGEVSLIDGAPRSATCTALQHTVVVELGQQAYAALLREEPAIAAQLITTMNRNLSASLASARRTLLLDSPVAARPVLPTPAPAQCPVSGGAMRSLRASMSDHMPRVFGPLGPRTRVTVDGGPGPSVAAVDARVADLLAWPAHRLRPALEAGLRERLGALPSDHLVALPPGAAVAGLLDLLELSVRASLQEDLQLYQHLPADRRPALLVGQRLPPAWLEASEDSLLERISVPSLHDGRPDPAALTAALLDNAHRSLRLVVLPRCDAHSGVALDVEGLTQLVHDSGGVVVWVAASSAAPPPLRARVSAAGREMADRDAVLVDVSRWPGCGASPVLGVVGHHLPLRSDRPPVPLAVLARAWAWLETFDQLGMEAISRQQACRMEETVARWRGCPGLRLVGTPEAERPECVAFRLRGPTGSIPAPLAQAIARDHWGVELGLDPEGGALQATLPWWLDEEELEHVRWSVVQLAARAGSLREDYVEQHDLDGATTWQHRRAQPAPSIPECAPDKGAAEDWARLQGTRAQARCG